MGAEQSACAWNDSRSHQMKPNKVKSKLKVHFSIKAAPKSLVNLIANREWQKVLVLLSTDPGEVYVWEKVRLYGVNRKLLPLHLACALRPPVEVVDALLRADSKMVTACALLKNYHSKKMHRSSAGALKELSRSISVAGTSTLETIYSPRNRNKVERRIRSRNIYHVQVSGCGMISPPNCASTTNRTLSLPSIETSQTLETSQSEHSPATPRSSRSPKSPEYSKYYSESPQSKLQNQIFFPDHMENDAVSLQLTPSGDVKQISPTSSCSTAASVATECNDENENSPFAYAYTSKSHQPLSSEYADHFLPLHIACLFRASPRVIQSLLHAYPAGAQQKNKWGMLPIHILAANLSLDPPEINSAPSKDKDHTNKQFLTSLYAEAEAQAKAKEPGTQNDADHHDWDIETVIKSLFAAFPQSTNLPSNNLQWLTPTEYAQKNFPDGPTKRTILSVLRTNTITQLPRSPRTRPTDVHTITNGRTASSTPTHTSTPTQLYHSLTQKDWPAAVLRLSQSPEEASTWVTQQEYDPYVPRLPIHVACSLQAPREVVSALLDAYPQGADCKERTEFLPLHTACRNGAPLGVVRTLLRAHPEAAFSIDAFGRLPLHLACSGGASLAVIESLLRVYPESREMKDYNGHTAFTYVDQSEDVEISHRQALAILLDQRNSPSSVIRDSPCTAE